jgi:hypothetical protein
MKLEISFLHFLIFVLLIIFMFIRILKGGLKVYMLHSPRMDILHNKAKYLGMAG